MFTPKFKVGDPCYVESELTRNKSGIPTRQRVYVKSRVIYAHPAYGWASVQTPHYHNAYWNEEILSPEEYKALRKR